MSLGRSGLTSQIALYGDSVANEQCVIFRVEMAATIE